MHLLRRPGFGRLLLGQTVSGLGDWMATFAFMALALSISDSPAAVGGILTLRLLGAVPGASLAGKVASRWDRRRTMVAMDVVRAGIVVAVPFVHELWWVYLWAFVLEGAGIVFVSSRDASVPDLVDERDLPLANGLVLGTSYGGIPVGAALFAGFAAVSIADSGLFADERYALVFFVDAATFVVSALAVAGIRELRGPDRGGEPATEELHREAGPARVGLRDAWRVPLVRSVMPATTAVAIGLGALFSLGIVLVRDDLSASDTEYGILIALFGAGAGLGLSTSRRLGDRDLLTSTRLGVLAMGALVAVMSLSPTLWLTYLGAVGFGAAATVAITAGMSALQTGVDGDERVVAFAAFQLVIRVGLGVSAVVAGLLADAIGAVDLGDRELAGTRAVLLASGVLVTARSLLVRPVDPAVAPGLPGTP